jgi:hypothetical protein
MIASLKMLRTRHRPELLMTIRLDAVCLARFACRAPGDVDRECT